MARPRSLTPARIAAAALALIDRDGLPALSMRTVAAELGMGVMSLYRYVEDREQLERLLVDVVLEGIDLTLPVEASWSGRVTVLVERVSNAVGVHPAVLPLIVAHRQASRSVFRWAEAVLGVLTEAGFTGDQRVIIFRCLLSYVIGALQYQQLGPLAGTGTEALAALPQDEWPLLAETARDGRRIAADEELRRGLAVLLNGISHAAPRSAGVRQVQDRLADQG